jgi:hypothetical protein
LLGGHDPREILLVLHHEIEQQAQLDRSLLGGQGAPGRLCLFRRGNRALRFLGTQRGNMPQDSARRGVGDSNAAPFTDPDPFAVNIIGFAEQGRILECRNESLVGHDVVLSFRIR